MGSTMIGIPDSSLTTASDRLRAMIAAHSPTPEQLEKRKLALRHFEEQWCRDPWRAEQVRLNGQAWLEACFDSAALAYDLTSKD